MGTKPAKHKQTKNRLFLNRNNYRLKKTGSGQIPTQDLCCPRRIRYHPAKRSRNTSNFELFMNQGTTSSMSSRSPVDKVGYEKKV